MNYSVINVADLTYDTEACSEVPRELSKESISGISDSITIVGNGDRIKVTLLRVIDPCDVKKSRLNKLFNNPLREKGGLSEGGSYRDISVKLMMRNLEEAGGIGMAPIPCEGILIGDDGSTYCSSGDTMEGHDIPWPPRRGEWTKMMCDCFHIPREVKPVKYVLPINSSWGAQAGEWNLAYWQEIEDEKEQDFDIVRQLQILESGVEIWNDWRAKNPKVRIHLASAKLNNRELSNINLSYANIEGTNFNNSNLSNANFLYARAGSAVFINAQVQAANFGYCDLTGASFFKANATQAKFDNAIMSKAVLENVSAYAASFRNAYLDDLRGSQANLWDCVFDGSHLDRADLTEAQLGQSSLIGVSLNGTILISTQLLRTDFQASNWKNVSAWGANLYGADLTDAIVLDCDLMLVNMVNIIIEGASIVNSYVFGVSAWNIKGTPKIQNGLIVTQKDQTRVTVDDLEIASFVYLILDNRKLRNVVEAVGKKGVLILGRFTEGKDVLEAIKNEVRRLELIPIAFDFERPSNRDLTETIMILAGMSRFIVADITAPRSVPLEAQAIIPNFMVPFASIIRKGEEPFSMFNDLLNKHPGWVLQPLEYDSLDQLVRIFEKAVVEPANRRFEQLRMLKAESLITRKASDYE